MTAIDATGDPDGLDAMTMALVGEAVGLLRDATVPRQAAVEATVQRVKVEAVLGAIAGTIFGSFGRVARATPDLMGLNAPLVHRGDDLPTTEDT